MKQFTRVLLAVLSVMVFIIPVIEPMIPSGNFDVSDFVGESVTIDASTGVSIHPSDIDDISGDIEDTSVYDSWKDDLELQVHETRFVDGHGDVVNRSRFWNEYEDGYIEDSNVALNYYDDVFAMWLPVNTDISNIYDIGGYTFGNTYNGYYSYYSNYGSDDSRVKVVFVDVIDDVLNITMKYTMYEEVDRYGYVDDGGSFMSDISPLSLPAILDDGRVIYNTFNNVEELYVITETGLTRLMVFDDTIDIPVGASNLVVEGTFTIPSGISLYADGVETLSGEVLCSEADFRIAATGRSLYSLGELKVLGRNGNFTFGTYRFTISGSTVTYRYIVPVSFIEENGQRFVIDPVWRLSYARTWRGGYGAVQNGDFDDIIENYDSNFTNVSGGFVLDRDFWANPDFSLDLVSGNVWDDAPAFSVNFTVPDVNVTNQNVTQVNQSDFQDDPQLYNTYRYNNEIYGEYNHSVLLNRSYYDNGIYTSLAHHNESIRFYDNAGTGNWEAGQTVSSTNWNEYTLLSPPGSQSKYYTAWSYTGTTGGNIRMILLAENGSAQRSVDAGAFERIDPYWHQGFSGFEYSGYPNMNENTWASRHVDNPIYYPNVVEINTTFGMPIFLRDVTQGMGDDLGQRVYYPGGYTFYSDWSNPSGDYYPGNAQLWPFTLVYAYFDPSASDIYRDYVDLWGNTITLNATNGFSGYEAFVYYGKPTTFYNLFGAESQSRIGMIFSLDMNQHAVGSSPGGSYLNRYNPLSIDIELDVGAWGQWSHYSPAGWPGSYRGIGGRQIAGNLTIEVLDTNGTVISSATKTDLSMLYRTETAAPNDRRYDYLEYTIGEIHRPYGSKGVSFWGFEHTGTDGPYFPSANFTTKVVGEGTSNMTYWGLSAETRVYSYDTITLNYEKTQGYINYTIYYKEDGDASWSVYQTGSLPDKTSAGNYLIDVSGVSDNWTQIFINGSFDGCGPNAEFNYWYATFVPYVYDDSVLMSGNDYTFKTVVGSLSEDPLVVFDVYWEFPTPTQFGAEIYYSVNNTLNFSDMNEFYGRGTFYKDDGGSFVPLSYSSGLWLVDDGMNELYFRPTNFSLDTFDDFYVVVVLRDYQRYITMNELGLVTYFNDTDRAVTYTSQHTIDFGADNVTIYAKQDLVLEVKSSSTFKGIVAGDYYYCLENISWHIVGPPGSEIDEWVYKDYYDSEEFIVADDLEFDFDYDYVGNYTVNVSTRNSGGFWSNDTINVTAENNSPYATWLITGYPFGTPPPVATTLTFDASGCYDIDYLDYIVSYNWTWGDGTWSNTTSPKSYHSYLTQGPFHIRLDVFDTLGGSDFSARDVTLDIFDPVVSIKKGDVVVVNLTNVNVDESFTLSSAPSSAGSGVIDYVIWSWGDGTSDNVSVGAISHLYDEVDTYILNVTVYNSLGRYASRDYTVKALISEEEANGTEEEFDGKLDMTVWSLDNITVSFSTISTGSSIDFLAKYLLKEKVRVSIQPDTVSESGNETIYVNATYFGQGINTGLLDFGTGTWSPDIYIFVKMDGVWYFANIALPDGLDIDSKSGQLVFEFEDVEWSEIVIYTNPGIIDKIQMYFASSKTPTVLGLYVASDEKESLIF